MKCLINGESSDSLSSLDRGLLYGDGLFETIAIGEGRAEFWPQHLARLQEGCARLAIPMPDSAALKAQLDGLCSDAQRAVVKLIVTRGVGGRGYRSEPGLPPTVILQLHPWPDYPPEHITAGVRIRSCQTTLSAQPRLAGLKHLNRLEQVLARQEWQEEGIVEGVMCDAQGRVIEGTMSNLFFIQGKRLITPALEQCGVAGIMRQQVLEACKACGIEHAVQPLELAEARRSDGLWLTNSLLGVWPVRQWDDTTYPIHGQLLTRLINHINKKR